LYTAPNSLISHNGAGRWITGAGKAESSASTWRCSATVWRCVAKEVDCSRLWRRTLRSSAGGQIVGCHIKVWLTMVA